MTTDTPAPPPGAKVYCLTSGGKIIPAPGGRIPGYSWIREITWEGAPRWYPLRRPERPGERCERRVRI